MLTLLLQLPANLFADNTVTIGSGTNTGYLVPANTYYNYSYTQQIVLQSEIATAGQITKIRFYMVGGISLSNSNNWTIYLGHTTKTSFSSTTDWVPLASMTQVFSGTIAATPVAGWYEIVLTGTFIYNNTDNLVVAVDENATGLNGSTNYVRIWTTPVANRAMHYRSDGTNPDPASPPTATGRLSYMNQMQLDIGAPPTCLQPSGLSTTNITSSSATVNWTASTSNPSGGYDIYYNTSSTAPTAGTTPLESVAAGVTTYNMSSLSAATTYYVWVRANCGGGDLSSWAGYTSFTTACTNAALTVNEGFNTSGTSVFPTCWSQQYVTGTSALSFLTSGSYPTVSAPYEGTRMVYWNSFNYSNGQQTRLVSTPITTTGTASVDVEFRWYHGTDGGSSSFQTEGVQVQYSTDGSTWVNAGSFIKRYDATAGWSLKTITLPVGAGNQPTIYVGFLFTSNYGYNCFLDAASIKPSPSCLTPTALMSSPTSTTSGTVSWTASTSNPSGGYDIYYSTSSTAPTGGTTPLGSVAAGITTYNISSLSANTTYYVWVRSNCGSGSYSDWAGYTSFYTGYCVPSAISVDGTGITNVTFGLSPNIVNNTTAAETNNYGNYSAQIGDLQQSVSSTVSITYSTGYGYYTKIWIDLNNDLDFLDAGEEVYSGESTSTNPTTLVATFTIPGSTSLGNHRMRIGGGDSTVPTPCMTGNSYMCFEDYTVNVTAAPSCADMPSALTSSAITTSSATISWTAASPAPGNGYEYYYSTSSTAPTAGTTPSGSTAAGVTSKNLSGLLANTTYYFWVRSNCNGTDKSGWAGSASFYTGYCVPPAATSSATYISNFVTTGGQTNISNNSGAFATNGYIDYSSTMSASQYATGILGFSVTIVGGTAGIAIYVDWNNDLDFSDSGEKAYTSNAYQPTGVTTSNFTVPSGTPVGDYRMRVVTDYSSTNPAACSFAGTRGEMEDYKLTVTAPPSCWAPTGLGSSNITDVSATISWTASTSNPSGGYNIYYSTSSTAPTAGTTPSASVGAGITTYNMTGLSSSTTYYVWVRANCGSGDYSAWSSSINFSTRCAVITTFPWTEGFEGLASVGTTIFPNCWLEGTGTNWCSQDVATTTYNDPRTGSKYVGCYYNGTNDRLWTPGFQLTAGVSYDFSTFFVGDGYAGWTGNIVYNTDQSATGETVLGSAFITSSTTSTNGTNYAQILRSFTPTISGVYYFGIRISSTSAPYSSISFDDFRLEPTPTCFFPLSVTSTAVTSNSATVNWSASVPPPAQGYQIYYSTSSTNPTAGTTPSASVGAGITTYNLSGLASQTTYYVWVRGNCGSGDVSSWSSSINFTTQCDPVSTLPWTENFDGMGAIGNSIIPSCWKVESTGTPWWSANAASNTYTDPYSSPNYIACNWSPSASDKYIITPGFNLTAGNTYDFSFMWVGDNYTGWTSDVRYNTSQTGVGSTVLGSAYLASGTTSPTTYAPVSRWFTPTSTGVYYFMVRVNNNATPYWLGFDNFKLELLPECDGPPTAGTASVLPVVVCGGNTVTATLTGFSSEIGVEFQWQQSANGTTGWTNVSGGSGATTPVYISGALTDKVYYRCKVTCSNTGDFAYSNTVLANVDAIVQTTLPWTEGFENITGAGVWPCGWAISSATHCATYTANTSYNRVSHTGTKFAAFRWSNTTAKWMYTKGFDLTAGQAYKFSFWFTTDGATGWSNLRAMYGTSQTPAAMTNAIQGATVTTPSGTAYQQVIGYFMPSSSGVYYIGVSVNDNINPDYLSVDDFSLEEFDGCISMPTPGIASAVMPVVCTGSGTTINLSGQSTGNGITLQWEQSADGSTGWANVSGGSGSTSASYTTPNLTAVRYYRCKVTCTNTNQFDYSTIAMVGVNPNPAVTINGATQVCSGYTTTLTANVTGGAGTITYQWQKQVGASWVNVGSNSNTYVTEPIAAPKSYRCVVNGSAGCVQATSSVHNITVNNDPVITTYGATTVCSGGQALIGVNVTTNFGGLPTYQWYYYLNGYWKIATGFTGPTLLTNPPYTRDYKVRVYCPGAPCAYSFSEVITVQVVPDPVVVIQPLGRNICVGGSHTMNIGVAGGLDNTYQWQSSTDLVSWHNIPGANALEYQATNLQESYYFRCVVTGTDFGCAGETYSNPAFVNVYPDPSIVISAGATYCVGGSKTLKSIATGGCGVASYQWQVYNSAKSTGNWENIPNATEGQITVAPVSNTQYRCIYSKHGQGCDDAISNIATITVLPDPYFVQQPQGAVVNLGDSYLLSVEVAGGMELSYQWQYLFNGIWQDIPGAVGTSLLANPPYTRSYRVWVTSNGLNCNAIISNIATLEVVDPLTKAPIEDVNMPDESEQTPEPNTEVLASMNLYPNPFRNELNIYLEDCSAGPVVIEVYNLTGSLIYRLDLETETDSFFWQMDISDWAPSIYMFRIENGNQVMVKRAVKN